MSKSWYTIRAAANGKSATVDILEEIGFWGVTSADFARDLKNLGDVESIKLRINSPGGSMWDAAAIASILEAHPATVTAEVVGLAASAASFILTAADRVHVARNAFIMMHMPQVFAAGESEELRRMADLLDKVADKMVAAYASKMKRNADEVRAMLSAETWFSAEEALEAGLADKIIGEVKVTASFDVRNYVRTIPAALERNLTSEENMGDKSKTPTPELSEDTISAIAAKVADILKAQAPAAPEAPAPAAPEAQAPAAPEAQAPAAPEAPAPAATDAASVRAEVAQILDLCAIAGVPEKGADYVKANKSLAEVMADLRQNRGGTPAPLNTRSGTSPEALGKTAAPAELDVAKIYSKWNDPKKKRA